MFPAYLARATMMWVQRALPYVAFAFIVFAVKVFVINHFGNATPYWDQWDAEADNLYRPWIEGSLRWNDLFVPHNEHRIFITRILALALFELNGKVWDPLLQMVVNAGLHVLALLVLMYFLGQTCPDRAKILLFSFACILFSIPYGWENTLAGFQSPFYFLLLFSFMFLWCIVQYQSSGKLRFLVGIVSCAMLSFFSLASGALTIATGVGVVGVQRIKGVRRNMSATGLMLSLFTLFIIAITLTPMIEGHALLKAKSFSNYIHAVLAVMSWPAKPVFGIFFYIPMLVFIVWQLFNWHVSRYMTWFTFSMCLWVIGQIMSIAYGRAAGGLASRYLDVFSVGLIVNFVCILLLKENCKVLANFFKYFSVFWLLLVIHGFVKTTPGVIADLQEKQYIGGEQEKNVRAYLASEDSSHLENKPFLHIPYPKADRLKTLLDNKIIRAFLPSNLAPPLSPSLVEVSELVLDTAGYYPTTPNLHMRKTYGTYNSQGNISQGLIRLDFDNKTSSRIYGLFMSGYPTQAGMSVFVKEASGNTYKIQPDHDPKEAWESFFLPIGTGTFSISLEDRSSSFWVAISGPFREGRIAAQRRFMLLSSHYFLALGLVLLVLLYGGFEVYGYEAPRQ